jgi:hypothetical protein
VDLRQLRQHFLGGDKLVGLLAHVQAVLNSLGKTR